MINELTDIRDTYLLEDKGLFITKQPSPFASISGKYQKWKTENPDEDYQYDEIHDFISTLSRGELCLVFESLLNMSK